MTTPTTHQNIETTVLQDRCIYDFTKLPLKKRLAIAFAIATGKKVTILMKTKLKVKKP